MAAAVIDTTDYQNPPWLRLSGFNNNFSSSTAIATTTGDSLLTTLMRSKITRSSLSLELSTPQLPNVSSFLVSCSLYCLGLLKKQATTLATVTNMGDLGLLPNGSVSPPLFTRPVMREAGDFSNDEFHKAARFSWLLEDPKAVGPVSNQGKTLSCWAFVTSDTVSANDYIHNGNHSILGVQELVDCMHHRFYPDIDLCMDSYGYGTSTASYDDGFRYVYTHGLYLEEDYPYVRKRGKCRELDKPKTFIYGYHVCYENDWKNVGEAVRYTKLEEMIMACPVGAVIRVYDSFQGYKPGKYTDGIYTPTIQELDDDKNEIKRQKHAVLVIGFGSEGGVEYYVIKNSAGKGWGHCGFAKVRREYLRNFAYPICTYLKKPKQYKAKHRKVVKPVRASPSVAFSKLDRALKR